MHLSDTKISVLDLVPILSGKTISESFKNSLELAQHVERLGYNRFWLSEHHNMNSVASSATSILISYIAQGTKKIRVGSGGIMLPNHAPLVIAEQFGTLETLYPGRIDLGLGRAPGTDPLTAKALRRNLMDNETMFNNNLNELRQYFEYDQNLKVNAIPGKGLAIPIWLLGSSLYSARLAATLGLPFAFASHFAPKYLMSAIQVYRDNFQPSKQLKDPYIIACVNVICADNTNYAHHLATSLYQLKYNIRRGIMKPLQPPIDDIDEMWSHYEKDTFLDESNYTFIGDQGTVKAKVQAFLQQTMINELMITSHIYSHEARLHSYQLLYDLWK